MINENVGAHYICELYTKRHINNPNHPRVTHIHITTEHTSTHTFHILAGKALSRTYIICTYIDRTLSFYYLGSRFKMKIRITLARKSRVLARRSISFGNVATVNRTARW